MVTDSRSAQNEMLNFEAPAFTPKSPTTSIMQDPACLYGRREVASENAPDESDYDNPCLTEDERVRRLLWRKLLSMDFESWKIRFAVETRGLRKLPDCVQTIMTLPDPEKDEKKCAATKRSRGRNAKEKRELRDPPGCLMFRSGIRCVHENCFRSYRKKRTFPPCFRQFQQGGCSGKSCEFRHSPGLKKESDKLAEIRRDIMGRLSVRDGSSNNRSGGRPSERWSDRRHGSEGQQDRQKKRSDMQNSGGQQGGWQDRQQSSRPTDQSNGWRQSGQSGGQQSGRQRGRRCDDPRQSGQ
eukprot:418748_1